MSKLKVLLCENIHPKAKENLEQNGFDVELISYAPDEKELIEILPKYDAIGIRSKTKMTENVIKNNPHLLTIGCFCIGTNQVELKEAAKLGIPVFNAPHSNTRSVAELVIALSIVLLRKTFHKSMLCHQGLWDKSAKGSNELRQKTLGIVGYGHIGSQVSVLAEALGMTVIYYDSVAKLPLGNARACQSLSEVLEEADVLSLHVPENVSSYQMIKAAELKKMKDGSVLINASRGQVVELDHLASAVKEKKLRGAAIDVFPIEPKDNDSPFDCPLIGLENVILTPHIGGSTIEAQENIATEVAQKLSAYIKNGSSAGACNFPELHAGENQAAMRLLHIHQNIPGMLQKINSEIASVSCNVSAQYLMTKEQIGYAILDLEQNSPSLLERLQMMEGSIKVRAL